MPARPFPSLERFLAVAFNHIASSRSLASLLISIFLFFLFSALSSYLLRIRPLITFVHILLVRAPTCSETTKKAIDA